MSKDKQNNFIDLLKFQATAFKNKHQLTPINLTLDLFSTKRKGSEALIQKQGVDMQIKLMMFGEEGSISLSNNSNINCCLLSVRGLFQMSFGERVPLWQKYIQFKGNASNMIT